MARKSLELNASVPMAVVRPNLNWVSVALLAIASLLVVRGFVLLCPPGSLIRNYSWCIVMAALAGVCGKGRWVVVTSLIVIAVSIAQINEDHRAGMEHAERQTALRLKGVFPASAPVTETSPLREERP